MKRHSIHRFLGSAVIMLLVLALVAGCSKPAQNPAPPASGTPTNTSGDTPAPEPEPQAPPVLIRIGYASDPDYTQLANYKWEEYLQSKYGYQVEHYFFDGSQVAYKALLAGAIDVSVAAVLPAIQVSMQSPTLKLKLIASDLQAPDYVLVSRQGINSLKDLEGGRLGISTPGDISDTLSRAVLQREGIDMSKVNILKIGGTGARMAALLSDQIDAGMAHADSGLAAAEKGLNILYAVGNSTQGYLQHGLVANEKWISKDTAVTQNVVNAFIDSVRWAAGSKEEYIEFSKQWIPEVSDNIRNEAYDIFTNINMFAVNGGLSQENLQTTLDLELEAGSLEEAVAFEEWVDTTFVDAYLAANGTK